MPARNIFSLSFELLILFRAFAVDYMDIAVKADCMFHLCGNNWFTSLEFVVQYSDIAIISSNKYVL
ncbi:hypothetical protein C5745_08080 [Sphingobacterium haloxyli]|uniref:Uncharacterized protein n=1 Tax=Sphingobacterium haloxyli TaxID=2100533 RepID=A0A2S9J4Z7_9SPHI|nr:hypothetical protein C5745_08080 [Sphingobacterium haloxyli]